MSSPENFAQLKNALHQGMAHRSAPQKEVKQRRVVPTEAALQKTAGSIGVALPEPATSNDVPFQNPAQSDDTVQQKSAPSRDGSGEKIKEFKKHAFNAHQAETAFRTAMADYKKIRKEADELKKEPAGKSPRYTGT